LSARFSQVEGDCQNAIAIDAAIGPLAAPLDRIEGRAAAVISGLTPELDGLISLRVAVAVDGGLAKLAAARAVPQPESSGDIPDGVEERLDLVKRALGEVARRLGALETVIGALREAGAVLALALGRPF
jgi:hypothetical protein